MRYTVLIDESSDLRIMNLIEKFDLGKEINSNFFIPVYSYIIFEGKVELNFTKKGLVKVDNNIIKTEVKELELGKNLDDATMEGIKRSLKYLIKRGYTDDVVIYSDRKTVIDCINNQSKYYAEVKDLIDKFNIIKFTWIPRTFNGWADKLAREERKKTTNISIELFEEILNKLIVIKETNELYLETLSNFNNEKQINTNLRRKIDNLENTIMQIRKSNRNLKTINKKLETNKDTYKNIIEKQNKEIQKFNSLYSENENNKYIIRQQGSKIKDLRDINKELLDDLQYYKRKFQELKNENNDLVKKLDEKYKEEFLEEFEIVGSSKEL